MIEQAPQIERTDKTIPILAKLQMNGNIQKIQDEYLYWDKIKYKAKDEAVRKGRPFLGSNFLL